MAELKGSKTEVNLMTAFSSECLARVRYEFYEAKARAEGFMQIAELFKETSLNEKEHSEIIYKQLNGGISDTQTILKEASDNENYEWSKLYADFATEARQEGFEAISDLFARLAEIEKHHEQRFNALLANTENGKVFSKDCEDALWICRSCGNELVGSNAPDVCPVCGKPKGYFQVKASNY